MGVELMIISAALQAFQGFQQYQSGKAQAKQAQQTASYNAQVAENRAAIERQQLSKQQRLFTGSQKVRAAASGASIGSFDDLFESTEQEQLLDLSILDYNTKLERDQILYGGRVEASAAKRQGQNALISGLAGSASSLGQYSSYKSQPKAPTTKLSNGNTIYWNSSR